MRFNHEFSACTQHNLNKLYLKATPKLYTLAYIKSHEKGLA
jgi:hypothetical protein